MRKLLLSFLPILLLTSCSSSRHVTLVHLDGHEEAFEYQGDSFTVPVPTVAGYYYMGGFKENNMNSTQYIDIAGQSVNFKEIDDYPEKIYHVYHQKLENYVFETSYNDITLSSSGSKSASFSFDDTLAHYLALDGYKAYVRLQFVHYEKEEGVIGINTFDWSTYEVSYGDAKLDSGSLRANGSAQDFDYIYDIGQLMDGAQFRFVVTRPSNCVSTASATYKHFKATFYVGDDQFLASHKYDNLNIKENSTSYSCFVDNGSLTLNSTYSKTANVTYNLPWNLKDYLVEHKKEIDAGKVKIIVNNYGSKGGLFGAFSNWSNYTVELNSSNSLLAEGSGHLESNSAFKDSANEISITDNYSELNNINFAFTYGSPGGSPNASGMFYYVHYIKLVFSI